MQASFHYNNDNGNDYGAMESSLYLALLLLSVHGRQADGFSSIGNSKRTASTSSFPSDVDVSKDHHPLLRKFGRGISKRIRHSEEGTNRFGQAGAYTSEETIPCLDMQGSDSFFDDKKGQGRTYNISSRTTIRKAFTESSGMLGPNNFNNPHGRSSGSGCTIIRLTGSDAESIHGLTQYSNRFFDKIDNDKSDNVKNAGVFRIEDMVYAGFDSDVNGEGKMQFLDTRILPSKHDIDPLLLPMEVGELVGSSSLHDAHKGMNTLLDIGTQITSAVLDMDTVSAEKLIDDGTHIQQQQGSSGDNVMGQHQSEMVASDVSNSYHRLIRYLKPQQSGAAFQAHIDSSFLTLIPMPEVPGLEVWCPSNAYDATLNDEVSSTNNSGSIGEWVRPIIPFDVSMEMDNGSDKKKHAYVIAMAGEFLQLTSNGNVPTCIHRVIPPKPPAMSLNNGMHDTGKSNTYKPRISAPMFLRPRRCEGALLDVGQDLNLVGTSMDEETSSCSSVQTSPSDSRDALYFEEGLLDECDGMHLWSAHEIRKRK